MITDKQLDEWRELSLNASYGPWYAGHTAVFAETAFGSMELVNEGVGSTENDLSFIAEARTIVPVLIREVTRLRKALDNVNKCETCSRGPSDSKTCEGPAFGCWKPKE